MNLATNAHDMQNIQTVWWLKGKHNAG